MLAGALVLAVLAVVTGWVRPAEVPGLFDLHVLSLFFVLIVAVECAKKSRLFAFGVRAVLARVRSARVLAAAAVLVTGATAALVTNDVALLLVVPFTLAFEASAPGFEAAGLIVLEIASANVLGCLTPTGNPQNLFLFVRGGFTSGSRIDFTLVAVFAALFVGVEGLRRSTLFHALDPIRLFGASPSGFVLSGALLSQAVSNVPAALLLAPAAAAAPAGAFTALLYGVNAGGCGTPIASLANLIGARLYLSGRSSRRAFWRLFAAVSTALLALAVLLSLGLVKYSAR